MMKSLAQTAPLQGLAAAANAPAIPEPDRFILSWGDNTNGQCLLDAESSAIPAPRLVPCRRPMRSLAAGWEHSLLVDSGGGLWGGGANKGCCLSEERADGERLPLTRLDVAELDGVPFEAVQMGRDHALAVLEGGRAVISWGPSNEYGQVGHGPASQSRVRPGVVHLSGVAVRQVACGEFHSLVLTVQGEVFSFGAGTHGTLGVGRRESIARAEKVVSNHLRAMPVRAIAAGAQTSLALSIGGQVYSWGCNGRGRLGLGPTYDQEDSIATPTVVRNLPGMARAIAAGGEHSAVILRRGRLFLAGDNSAGQLGQMRSDVDWTSTFYELPFHDYTLRVRAVALGCAHTLILSYDGELYACGRNAEGQLGNACASPAAAEPAPPIDIPTRLLLNPDGEHCNYVVVGIASCHDHSVVLALSMPDTHRKVRSFRGPELNGVERAGRPMTATMKVGRQRIYGDDMPSAGPVDFNQTLQPGCLKTFADALRTINEAEPEGDTARPDTSLPDVLTSGCTSRVGKGSRNLVVTLSTKGSNNSHESEGTSAEEVVLLQPVVQPGVASSVGFAGLSVGKLLELIRHARQGAPGSKTVSRAADKAADDLRTSLAATFATPSLLNASFCFPGLYRSRLDAGGLLKAYGELSADAALAARVEAHLSSAAFEGLCAWANDHEEAASLIHRDQLRGIPALLLSPLFASPRRHQPYELMSRAMRLVAWMPPDGRRELQEIIIEDCSEEEVLRGLVKRVRDHCDETVRRAHEMQRLSPEIWEGLMLLQLLWGANEAIAARLDQSLRTRPEWSEQPNLGHNLSQTLSNLTATRNISGPFGKGLDSMTTQRFAVATPRVFPPVPASEFHLQSLAEELVPPELEFRLFIENACSGPITPKEVLDLPLYTAKTDYGFEYILPSKMRSFMANRNLVPVSYTRKVLQVENHHAQVYLQHQVARRVAADLEVLPGHEIHIDPALLFFILKVRRDHILEDTTQALERATPEDLRRQLKVVFEGEQGVDEGGLAREFFRLLSARVFTADCGLFDPAVAQNARVLWFDKNSSQGLTDFWLAGVILGLVVYNNMPGLDVSFPSVVFKKIKDEPLGLEDLRKVHPETYTSLRALLDWEVPPPVPGAKPMGAAEGSSLFEDTFCLDFTVTHDEGSGPVTRELCPGGRDKLVTLQNREEFVRLYSEWLLVSSVERQFEPFRKGVRRVCDSPLFNALDSAELELIVCGEQDLDFSQLRKNVHYEGFPEDSPYVESFWKLLLALDKEGKKRFLSFVTGSDLAPVGGLQELQLVVQKNGEEPTERLPTAHTCFNLLLLPEYGSVDKLERMLITAMHNAEGFGLE